MSNLKEYTKNFEELIKEIDKINQKFSSKIKIEELNEISEYIINAKEVINKLDKPNTIAEKIVYSTINIPFIGKYTLKGYKKLKEENLKSGNVNELVENIFNNFNSKKERLFEIAEILNEMKQELIKQKNKLEEYINIFDNIVNNTNDNVEKLKAMDISIIAKNQKLIIEEQLSNNIDFILELIENLIVKISKSMPILKNTINNSLTIMGAIQSIKNSLDLMKNIEELSNEIIKQSSNNIQELIVEVTRNLSDSTDIKFLEESIERNQKYQKLLMKERIKLIQKTTENYKILNKIEEDNKKIQNLKDKDIYNLIENNLNN